MVIFWLPSDRNSSIGIDAPVPARYSTVRKFCLRASAALSMTAPSYCVRQHINTGYIETTNKPQDAVAHELVHPPDQRFLKEMRERLSHGRAVSGMVQLHSDSEDSASEARNRNWRYGLVAIIRRARWIRRMRRMAKTERIVKSRRAIAMTHCPNCGARIVPTPKELREWRRAADLTQRRMGKLLGISAAYVAYLESGKRSPSASVIAR